MIVRQPPRHCPTCDVQTTELVCWSCGGATDDGPCRLAAPGWRAPTTEPARRIDGQSQTRGGDR